MKEEQFHIESNSPLLFTIKTSSEKIYKVLISDDLFESHTCTCPVYKAKGMCHHIEAVLNRVPEKKEEDIIYLDVETQLSANEVGGWNNIEDMKVAVVVIYSSKEDKFEHYSEENLMLLVNKLQKANLIVGFNIKRFDYRVIQPYIPDFSLSSLPAYDILHEVYKKLGHRISLNALAKTTLSVEKSADGLQSIEWFKNGEIEKIIEYCKQDVTITRDLFLYGRKYGYLKYYDKKQDKIRTVNLDFPSI